MRGTGLEQQEKALKDSNQSRIFGLIMHMSCNTTLITVGVPQN